MNFSEEAVTRWLATKAAAKHLGLHADTLRRLRREGGGPRYTRLPGTTIIRYRLEELDRYMDERSYSSTAEEVAGGAR